MRSPWHDLLPFTTHRIRLAGNLFTAEQDMEPDRDLRTSLVVETADAMGGMVGMSVVDLGCLEGGFALEFPRRGTTRVLGIELRARSVDRCNLACELTGLKQVQFVCGDICEALPAAGDPFDIVFAAGILYHLDRPAETLRLMRRMCTRFALVDTHIATRDGPTTHYCSEGEVELPGGRGEGGYRGRSFWEFDIGTHDLPAHQPFRTARQEQREFKLWTGANTSSSGGRGRLGTNDP